MTKIEGQPKRAMSAYFLWMNENRNKIKSELPSDAGIGDIAKAAGEKWKNMTEDDKSVSLKNFFFREINFQFYYTYMYLLLKVRYEIKIIIF